MCRWRVCRVMLIAMNAFATPAQGALPAVHQERLPSGEPYTLVLPTDASRETAPPLVVSLHYGGPVTPFYGRGLLEGLVEPALRELGAVMVAPDCAQRTWRDCEQSVLRVIEHLATTHFVDRRRIVLLGYSKGGIGTWDLASRHPALFSAAIVMAGQPGDDLSAAQWTVPLRAIQAGSDEIFPPAPTRDFITRLQARGVDASMEQLDDVTHYEMVRFSEPLRRTVPWLREQRQR
ncbi:MAG: putative peptidase [Gammaproteobacteria bacterium]|jgi:predicted peptidase